MNRTAASPASPSLAASLLAASLALPGAAAADVISKSRFESSGLLGLAAFRSETESRQAADRRDDRSRTFFTGAMMKFMSGKQGLEGRAITRLDKEVIWNLNPKEKEYTEVTFAEQRAMLDRGVSNMQGRGPEDPRKSPFKSAGEPTVEVQRTGKTWSVSGFEGKQAIATVRMPYYDSTQARTDTLVVKYDAFLTGDAALAKETKVFHEAYAKKMRMDMQHFRGLDMLFGYLEKPMTRLGKELSKTGETPLKFTMTVMKPVPPEEKGKSAAKADKEESPGMKVPTSVGDAAGEAMGQAFGMFKKKKAKEKQAAKEAQDAKLGVPANYVVLSTNSFEYTDIRIAPTQGTDYELPKDYKKVERTAAAPEAAE